MGRHITKHDPTRLFHIIIFTKCKREVGDFNIGGHFGLQGTGLQINAQVKIFAQEYMLSGLAALLTGQE